MKHGTGGCYKDLQTASNCSGPSILLSLSPTCQQPAKEDMELGIRQTTQLRWGTGTKKGTEFGENTME